VAADLSDAAKLLEDFRPLEDAESLVITERRRQRIEVVCLLSDVDNRDAHLASERCSGRTSPEEPPGQFRLGTAKVRVKNRPFR
jgi:hypothetical protein